MVSKVLGPPTDRSARHRDADAVPPRNDVLTAAAIDCTPWSGGMSLQSALNTNVCTEMQPGHYEVDAYLVIPDGHVLRGNADHPRQDMVVKASRPWNANGYEGVINGKCADTSLHFPRQKERRPIDVLAQLLQRDIAQVARAPMNAGVWNIDGRPIGVKPSRERLGIRHQLHLLPLRVRRDQLLLQLAILRVELRPGARD